MDDMTPPWSPPTGQPPAWGPPAWGPPAWAPSPPPAWRAPPPVPVRVRRRGWVQALVVAGLVVGGGALARTTSNDGPQWAKAWDPRVEPLARFVESARGLTFRHPVTVEFLAEAEFLAHVRSTRSAVVDSSTTDAAADLPLERAFGLVPRTFERGKTESDAAAGIVGAYSPAERLVRVRGETLTVAARVTLVHELTHALQDQTFVLRTVQSAPTSQAAVNAILGVIEGDASAVEARYVDELPAEDRESYAREESGVIQSPELARVPAALLTAIQLPYALGPALVETVDRVGGADRRNGLFRAPPANDLGLLFPEVALDDPVAPQPPARPAVAEGEEAVDSHRYGDDLGASGWLTVLAGRLDAHDAVRAVRAWSGDRYVTFRRGDAICARAAVRGSSAAGADLLESALRDWVARGPADAATATRDGTVVTLTSCDTGVGDPPTDGRFTDALALLSVRSQALTAATPGGIEHATTAQRVCLGDAFAAALTVDELRRLDEISSARLDQIREGALRTCGSTTR
jgi:hypothetical protein